MPRDIFLILVTTSVGAVISAIGIILVMIYNATQKNTLAMVTLTVELKYLREKISPLPEMQKDITEAHQKIRSLESKL